MLCEECWYWDLSSEFKYRRCSLKNNDDDVMMFDDDVRRFLVLCLRAWFCWLVGHILVVCHVRFGAGSKKNSC